MEHILPLEFCRDRDTAFDHHPDLSALAQALFTPRKCYLGVWKYHILIWFDCQCLQYVVELFSRVWCKVRCFNALFGMCQWNFATNSLWTVAGFPPNSMNTTCGEKAGGLAKHSWVRNDSCWICFFFSHVSSWFRFNLFALIFFIPPRNHGLSFKDVQRFRVSPGVNIGMGAPSPQDTEADGCTTSTVSTAPSSRASSYHPGQVTSGNFGNVIKPWKPWKPWMQIDKYPLAN